MNSLLEEPQAGWIVDPPFRRLSPNRYSGKYRPGSIVPIECIVYHYTAGGFDGSLRWLTSVDSSASAHFIVRKNGEIWQLVPLHERAWHAGGKTSTWRGKPGVNGKSIGIEIENWGELKKNGDQFLTYRGTPFKGSPAYDAEKIWDAYEDAQLEAVDLLTRALVVEFPQLIESDGRALGPPDGRFIGHQHVDPTRKIDPGPIFPWTRVLTIASAVRNAC